MSDGGRRMKPPAIARCCRPGNPTRSGVGLGTLGSIIESDVIDQEGLRAPQCRILSVLAASDSGAAGDLQKKPL